MTYPPAALPESAVPLLVRTDFSRDLAWSRLLAMVNPGAAGGVMTLVPLDDPAYDGLSAHDLQALGGTTQPVLAVADTATMDHGDLTVLVLPGAGARDDGRRPFRAVAAEVGDLAGSLTRYAADWTDYTDHLDAHGVFRGFPAPPRAALDEVDHAAVAAVRHLRALTAAPEPPALGGDTTTVTIERTVPAGPGRVRAAGLDLPSVWWGLGSTSTDFSAGRHFEVVVDSDRRVVDDLAVPGTAALAVIGSVVRAAGPDGATYTWQWRGPRHTVPAEPGRVTVRLGPGTGRSTRVTVEHRLPADLAAPAVALWAFYLRRLEAISTDRIAGARPPWHPGD